MSDQRHPWSGLLLSLLIVSPNFLWIALDRQPFGGDQSTYAIESVRLYYALAGSPTTWLHQMLQASPYRGPGLAWMGQFFMALAPIAGGMDRVLLFSIAIVEVITLWLVYRCILEVSGGKLSTAALSVLVIASAPHSVYLHHEYLTEPLQAFAAAVFMAILARAPKQGRTQLMGWLLVGSSVALLIRASTAVYVFVPGMVLVSSRLLSRRAATPGSLLGKDSWPSCILGVILFIPMAAWYQGNLDLVIAHAKAATSGEVAAFWGQEDTFVGTLFYWIGAGARAFFYPGVLATVCLSLLVGKLASHPRVDAALSRGRALAGYAAISMVQIAAVLVLFSFSDNRSVRYLMPLLPSIAVVICWGVDLVDRPAVTTITLAAFTFQLLLVQGFAFGLLPAPPVIAAHVRRLNSNATNSRILDEIMYRTCTPRDPGRKVTIIAIDPLLRGDWLAPVPVEYLALKTYGADGPCSFGYAGNGFFGSSLEDTWRDLVERHVCYVVTTDPARYPPPRNAANQALTPQNHPALVERLRTSGLFEQEPPLGTDPGILVFRRVECEEDAARYNDPPRVQDLRFAPRTAEAKPRRPLDDPRPPRQRVDRGPRVLSA